MTWWHTLILGLVQGVTEFLPISSSAHLALTPFWLRWNLPATEAFVFDVLVQVATLLAVVGYYRAPLKRIFENMWRDLVHRRSMHPDTRLGLLLLMATLPGVMVGMLFKEAIEAAFVQPRQVAVFLGVTALLMTLAELRGRHRRSMYSLHWWEALFIGGFQALALLPGISRSGATISGAMLRHLKREDAAHFSFLLAVPIMLGAGVVALYDLLTLPGPRLQRLLGPYLLGFVVAGVSGYVSIHLLLGYLRRRSLWVFVVYCLIVSALTWMKTS